VTVGTETGVAAHKQVCGVHWGSCTVYL